jgi:5-methylcytosine-specific restriction protein A
VQTYIDDDAGFVTWRDGHPGGYVVNHDREPRAAYLKLHRSGCRTIDGNAPPGGQGTNWTTAYAKTCSDSLAELVLWARTVGGPLEPCQVCSPPL